MEYLTHILDFFKNLTTLEYLPSLGDKVSLGLLFTFGLLTSFHCIAMCGGLVISGSMGKKEILPNVTYNLGRIASYTIIGGIAGSMGHAVGFTGMWKGIIPLIGGVFMILLAIKYLNVFPALRKINIKMPTFFARKVFSGKYHNTLVIGLLSGLMPCGPLQMVQLYALGTKSPLIGAVSSLVFALGTVPVLFTFGLINSVINKKHAKLVVRLSGAIVLVLGIAMLGRGLALAGIDVKLPGLGTGSDITSKNSVKTEVHEKEKIQVIETEIKSYEYPAIIVKKGISVRWNLKAAAESLNDCNNEIIIPGLKIEKKLSAGDNIIEFTPQKAGELVYTCWMGMIKSKIKVVD